MVSVAQTLQAALQKHQSGAISEAEQLYREIVRHDPRHADALHLLGVAAHQQNRHRSAVEFMTRAIELKPSAVYYSNLGAAFRALGERANAIQNLRSAVQLDSRMADAHYNLGTLLKDAGGFGEAIESLRRAVELQPSHAPAWNNLGILLYSQGNREDAVACYQNALAANPMSAEAFNNLGTALGSLGRTDDAIAAYCRALECRPNFADALFNLGNLYSEIERLDVAEACYQRVGEIEPRHVGAIVNLGLIHQERGDLDGAIACNSRAIEIDGQHVEAHVNRSFLRRLKGELREGFAEFEWRWKEESIPSRYTGPVWDGSSLAGKTILVYAEQGVGDEIMFASCIPDIVERAGHCIVECDRRLVPVFRRSFPQATMIDRWDATPPSELGSVLRYDLCIAAGSVLQHLRSTVESFPQRQCYLAADRAKTQIWRARFRELGDGLKVGISWRGGKRVKTQRKRSTAADDWRSILSVGNVQFVNLQYGDCREELAAFRQAAGTEIHHWNDSNPLADLDSFAAQIAALDLVISVDNSTVHMAGALGVPVWSMIPFSPDWRWQAHGDQTFWYPSMRLFRQPVRNDWESVFAEVAACLHDFARSADAIFMDDNEATQ